MKTLTVVCAFAWCLVALPAAAQTPPLPDLKLTCGDIQRLNVAYQYGQFGTWLEYIVATNRSITTCPMSVQVAAHVVNAEQSAMYDSAVFSAFVSKQVMVPFPGIWQTNGRHSFTYYFTAIPPTWYTFDLPPTVSHTLIELQRRRDPEYQCYELGGTWDGWECSIPNCPLIVDVARDGYRLTDVEGGVHFDLDADGVPERVSWTARDSDDVFIVMDRNGNGRIDDGTELFGNHTPAYPSRVDVTSPNGFEALKFLEASDYGAVRPDRIIDSADAPFAHLLLWRDANHNGLSEPDELEPLSAIGLRAIRTDYRTSRRRDRYGNEFRQRAKGVWEDGEHFIYDVWLRRQ